MFQRKREAAAVAGTASALAVSFFVQRYLSQEVKPPQLVHGPDEERQERIDEMLMQVQALIRDYRPHPLMEVSGLLSTLACGPAMALPELNERLGGRLEAWGVLTIEGSLEMLELKDGGTVSLHWGLPPPPEAATTGPPRVVVALPGLNNSSKTPYLQTLLRYVRQLGFQGVIFNYRGVPPSPLTSTKVGCSDSWQDLPEVLDHIEAKIPGAELFGIGYSMGGGNLLRYLGEYGKDARFRAAASIAAPLDYVAVSEFLESTRANRIFNFFLALGAASNIKRAANMYPELAAKINWDVLRFPTRLRDIDKAVVVPVNGYIDENDYYVQNSPVRRLQNIDIPTLILHAEDDPVVGVHTIPWDEVRKNPKLLAAVTKRGGHISWTGSGSADGASWVDRVAARFFEVTSAVSTPKRAARSGGVIRSKL